MPVPCRSLTEAATVSTPAIGAATAAPGMRKVAKAQAASCRRRKSNAVVCPSTGSYAVSPLKLGAGSSGARL
jgi:hypothetical protein